MTFASRVRLLCLTSALTVFAATGATIFSVFPAFALSDIKDITPPAADKAAPDPAEPEIDDEGEELLPEDASPAIPDPDPLIKPADQQDTAAPEPDAAPVEIIYDIEKAPEPVRRMRQLIIDAATSGDISRLRPLMNPGPDQTQVQLEGSDKDPIDTLKSLSGDPEGMEILAILLDILSTGFVHLDKGTPDEAYVWPYFTGKQLGQLTPVEKVELLRIVTAGDVAEMQEYGNYNFFRAGITPDGRWKFFTAGD
ncbi:hypothetical protein [Rhizobium sp. SL42]|uniref:hypothetical protein n=1 Tax=Rhizobium sp. SL42 TaxID=2806346 RepID=UPI001F200307|nr:hypothetical protein [Rhizobium sp. SL42]UJW76650.1 hypothetical protein IM739_09385 [Rhizobium sp. SL42]